MLYEGKTKIVEIRGDEAIVRFKNDITAGDGAKHDIFEGKGSICAELTAITMGYLNRQSIPTHFLDFYPPNTLKVVALRMFPLEVVVRFVKTGSFIRRYGGVEGESFSRPVVEFFIKDDARHDPMVCINHLETLGIASKEQAREMSDTAIRAAELLRGFFQRAGFDLWDIKFEFGLDGNGNVIIGDEISPDTCRLRRKEGIFDKDVYRHDIADPIERYKEVLEACRSIVSQ